MKIGIDCRLAGLKHAGIGRYTQSLVLNLLKRELPITWILFFYDQTQAKEVLQNYYQSKKVKVVITKIDHYSLEEQLKLVKIFKNYNLNLLHVPHFNVPIFYNKKLVVTIHDLLWHEHKGGQVTTLNPIKYHLKYFFYRQVTKIAIKKALKIFVPAQTIKDTVAKFYPKAKNKIIITKEGGELINKIEKPLKKLRKTFLYVGSLYPHKNIKLILRSLTVLTDYKLLIVGSRNIFRDKIQTFVKYKEIEDRVSFLGYVDDQKLAKLYSRVTALIQPSFSEGFGLTGVEAMSLGTPILASSIPIFKEIYQDTAYYFSPHSQASFINAVHKLENDNKHQDRVKKRTKLEINLSKTYDWDKMTLKTLKTYKEVIAQ